MALITCPECGKEISDRATSCPNCGCPQREWGDKKYVETAKKEKEIYWCRKCYRQNKIGTKYCIYCGNRIETYYNLEKPFLTENVEKIQESKKEFHGLYRYSIFRGKTEVYCPRCKSENCSRYQEQKIIPGKTKTRYTVNLNPLHPFTLVNKKEKVIKKEEVVTESKFVCNECGKVFV